MPDHKLPFTEVKIAGFIFKVKKMARKANRVEGRMGFFSSTSGEISICTDYPDDQNVDSLLHEIGHAIWWAYNIEESDPEERVVRTQATAWTQVFRDNPQLLPWIQRTLN